MNIVAGRFSWLLCLICCVFCSCISDKSVSREGSIEAFIRAYGHIRWFYPSDEAQTIDWNKFAIYGIQEVAACQTEKELSSTLQKLFQPLAPAAVFTLKSSEPKSIPLPAANDTVTFWQHYGVENEHSNYYISKRLNRTHRGDNLNKFCIFQNKLLNEYAGQKATFRLALKTSAKTDDFKAHLVLTQFNDGVEYMDILKNDTSQAVFSTEWSVFEKELLIEPNKELFYGAYVEGEGTLWIDEVSVFIEKDNKRYTVTYEDFEAESTTLGGNRLYEYSYDQQTPYMGNHSFVVTTRNSLFEETPSVDTIISESLDNSIRLYYPLALSIKNERTQPRSSTEKLNELYNNVQISPEDPELLKLADIAVVWNLIRYFSPYLDESSMNWDQSESWNDVLSEAIKDILYTDSQLPHYALNRMMAVLNDAHYLLQFDQTKKYQPPFVIQEIDNQPVITESYNEAFDPGDILEIYNGIDALEAFYDFKQIVSGSPTIKNKVSFYSLLQSYVAPVKVTVIRNGKSIEQTASPISMQQALRMSNQRKKLSEHKIIYPNAIYFDVAYLSLEEMKSSLQTDKIPIYDIRKGWGPFLLRRLMALIDETATHQESTIIPLRISPDKMLLPERDIPQQSPMNPRALFLIGANNLSNNETFLDYLKYRNAAIFIGENTGGCSGMVNNTTLPSGQSFTFTGARAFSLCGEDFYGVGVTPHYTVTPTMSDIIKGKDPVLEWALKVADEMVKE